MNRKQYRRHAIRHHQSGSRLGDIIAGTILAMITVGPMVGLIAYANHRDTQALKLSSFPSRPEEVEPITEPRTLDYLDQLPPAQG